MGHEYIKESDTFSTNRNGTVPKPSASDVSNNKVLRADGTWTSGGGGGGSSTLAGLDDVNLSSPSDGQILKYDNANSKWVNANNYIPHTYSTSEQVIGTWINGKPLYERCIDLGTFPNNATNNIDVSGVYADDVISVTGFGKRISTTYNTFFPLPFIGSSTSAFISIYAITSGTGVLSIHIVTGQDRTNVSGYAIVRYTKSTD